MCVHGDVGILDESYLSAPYYLHTPMGDGGWCIAEVGDNLQLPRLTALSHSLHYRPYFSLVIELRVLGALPTLNYKYSSSSTVHVHHTSHITPSKIHTCPHFSDYSELGSTSSSTNTRLPTRSASKYRYKYAVFEHKYNTRYPYHMFEYLCIPCSNMQTCSV